LIAYLAIRAEHKENTYNNADESSTVGENVIEFSKFSLVFVFVGRFSDMNLTDDVV